MRKLKSLMLYTALTLVANSLGAETDDIDALLVGDMAKLIIHSTPKHKNPVAFESENGAEMTLTDTNGKIRVVNFWATWCAPCRIEMPSLSKLQSELGSDTFEVITIASGVNNPAAMIRFFEEIGVDNLPLHKDPKQKLSREFRILGLPATVILDANSDEIARFIGDTDWSSKDAIAVISNLILRETQAP